MALILLRLRFVILKIGQFKVTQKRIAIVEPVFANIKHMKRLNRFTLRGKIKVNIQWVLYCMVHNLEKIANYGFA